jgi:hypothetical protein
MTLFPSGHPDTAIMDLEKQISELEHEYAERFCNDDNRAELKKIHARLEVLKAQLKKKEH